jgi:DnaJ like chaperone protein
MTFTEIMAIIIGGFLGYWIIDSFVNRVTSKSYKNNQKQSTHESYTQYESSNSEANSISETWFKTLEVQKDASKDQISKAYKKKMSQYHPDKVSSLGDELRKLAEEKSKEINAAYDYAMKFK